MQLGVFDHGLSVTESFLKQEDPWRAKMQDLSSQAERSSKCLF